MMLPESLRADPIAPALQRLLGEEYVLERTVGQGGFGRVFRAHDQRLDRAVAVKVLMPELSSEEFLARFRREGIALAKLRHPGVVPVYDIRSAGDLIALVMPFIDGETLRSRLVRATRIPPKEAHRVMLELCDALGAAHRAGIIHRDIKPDNIILEGALRKVLLMDFGIAVSSEAVVDEDEGPAGTPMYMSPEQIVGTEALDPRSDIYQLGAVVYHLVTGIPPFAATSPSALMAMHLSEPFVPVRTRNPSVPRAFAEVIERCLAKDRAQRPVDVHEVARELHAVEFTALTDRRVKTPTFVTPSSAFFAALTLSTFFFGAAAPTTATLLGASPWALLSALFAGLTVLSSPAALQELRDALPWSSRSAAVPAFPEPPEIAPEVQVTAASVFDALPSEMRERFTDVPDVLRRLEGAVVLLRARAAALAHREADADERQLVASRLAAATDALGLVRTDLLRLTAGAVSPGELTMALENARLINNEVSHLISAGREVEDIVNPQRAIRRLR